MNIIDTIEREQMRKDLPDFGPGDTVRVHVRVVRVAASVYRCSRAS